MNNLTEQQMDRMTRGFCPDCGHRGFVLGPRGAAARNIECGGCAKRFNITEHPMMTRIVFAHRIPSEAEGGNRWK